MTETVSVDNDFRDIRLRLQVDLEESQRKFQAVREDATRRLKALIEKKQWAEQSRQERREHLLQQIAQLRADLPQKQQELKDVKNDTMDTETKRQLEAQLAKWMTETANRKRNAALLEQEKTRLQKQQAQRKEQAQIEARVREMKDEALTQTLQLELDVVKPDSMLFLFKYVNPKDPEEVCSLQVDMLDTKMYLVPNCEPLLPSLDHLVDELNEDRDLFKFLKRIRMQFQEYFITNTSRYPKLIQ